MTNIDDERPPTACPTSANRREAMSPSLRVAVARQSDWACHYCGARTSLAGGSLSEGPGQRPWHVDHKTPVASGGTNDIDNLVLACQKCNLEKSDTPYVEYMASIADRRPRLVQALADDWLSRYQGMDLWMVLEGDDFRSAMIVDPTKSPIPDNAGVDTRALGTTADIVADVLHAVRSAAEILRLASAS